MIDQLIPCVVFIGTFVKLLNNCRLKIFVLFSLCKVQYEIPSKLLSWYTIASCFLPSIQHQVIFIFDGKECSIDTVAG